MTHEAASDAAPGERVEPRPPEDRSDVFAAILLALATILSAWGAYQATRWSGEQADAYAESAALRAEAGKHDRRANALQQVDVETFLDWVQARTTGNDQLSDFIATRFRTEFRPALDAWLATATEPEQVPAGTPFDLPAYSLAEARLAEDASARADAALEDARRFNQISDNFVLTAVLFASVLFFAGIASNFRRPAIRRGMLGVALVAFLVGLIVEFTLPQSIGF
jgi:hypothetical protein